MTCSHELSFRKAMDLLFQNYFAKTIEYTCDCGSKCEMEFKPLWRILSALVGLIILYCAEVLLKALYTRYYMFNVLICLVGMAIGIAAWIGSIYALYRFRQFKFTAIENYKPIVDRLALRKR